VCNNPMMLSHRCAVSIERVHRLYSSLELYPLNSSSSIYLVLKDHSVVSIGTFFCKVIMLVRPLPLPLALGLVLVIRSEEYTPLNQISDD
jgi:hypothetical protein